MTRKPELQINTTLDKFSKFLKALALIGILIGGTAGTSYITHDKIDSNLMAENRTRDSLITSLQADVEKHELRIQNVENTNVEIKASLIDIQKDIKTLLYISGKNEGYINR